MAATLPDGTWRIGENCELRVCAPDDVVTTATVSPADGRQPGLPARGSAGHLCTARFPSRHARSSWKAQQKCLALNCCVTGPWSCRQAP